MTIQTRITSIKIMKSFFCWTSIVVLLIPLSAATICKLRDQYWDQSRGLCTNCTICVSPDVVLRPCHVHQDTVCGPLSKLQIDWGWLEQSESQNAESHSLFPPERDSSTGDVTQHHKHHKHHHHHHHHHHHKKPKHEDDSTQFPSKNGRKHHELNLDDGEQPRRDHKDHKNGMKKKHKRLHDDLDVDYVETKDKLRSGEHDIVFSASDASKLLHHQSISIDEKALKEDIGDDYIEDYITRKSGDEEPAAHLKKASANSVNNSFVDRNSVGSPVTHSVNSTTTDAAADIAYEDDDSYDYLQQNRNSLPEALTSHYVSGSEPFSVAETLVWDWQAVALAMAVFACVLFFLVAGIYSLHQAKRSWSRLSDTFEADVEEMSSRMGLISSGANSETPNVNPEECCIAHRCLYLEQLLARKKQIEAEDNCKGNVYVSGNNKSGHV